MKRITVSLPDRKEFKMEARKLSKKNKYVKSVTWNGKPLNNNRIRHSDIMGGGKFVFVMTDTVKVAHPGKYSDFCTFGCSGMGLDAFRLVMRECFFNGTPK